jgi:hypothetical protein
VPDLSAAGVTAANVDLGTDAAADTVAVEGTPAGDTVQAAGASGRSPTRPCKTAAYSPLTCPQAACRSSARESSVVRQAARA